MRILLANKFYYPRGGDCTYTIGLEEILKTSGHQVAIFAMDYPQNLESPWQKYFPSEVSFSPKKPFQFLKALCRPLFSLEVYRKFSKLLDDFKPDVVHLNNIHTQLSPLIARIAHRRGIRVIWTLHDYKLLCPKYDCLKDGQPCELCFHDKSHVVKNRCMKGSRLASIIAWLEAKIWSRERLESYVDAFICPSRFMKRKMEEGGFSNHKLIPLHNFIDRRKVDGIIANRKEQYCYVGRLSPEKGVDILLKAASNLPFNLKVIGTGPLESELRQAYRDYPQIQFLGHQDWPSIKDVLASSRCMVLPSIWYENNPISVLEAIALGTPVIATDIGGLPELVTPGKTGLIAQAGDSESLEFNIRALFGNWFPVQGFDGFAEPYRARIEMIYAP